MLTRRLLTRRQATQATTSCRFRSSCSIGSVQLHTHASSIHSPSAPPSSRTALSSSSPLPFCRSTHTTSPTPVPKGTCGATATTRPVDDGTYRDASTALPATPSAAAVAAATSASAAASSSERPFPSSLPLPAVGSDCHFDLVVIGSGPSGQKCAIDAAKNGKRVCVVDKAGMFGGVCIHTGTIPSKTFREAILHMTAHRQRGFGGEVMARSPSLSRDVLDRVQKVEQWETETILKQLHRNKVYTVAGAARFVDPYHVEVVSEGSSMASSQHAGHIRLGTLTGSSPGQISIAGSGGVAAAVESGGSGLTSSHVIRADRFLVACGSRPARNPNYPWDSPLVFDSDAVLKNPAWGEINNLIVVGAGVIALEYASMFNTLPNCKVTIIDERPTFLDFIDHEVTDTLKYVMRREGATFLLGEKVEKVSIVNNGSSVRVDLNSGKDVVGDALFYAVGRQAESDSLGLDHAGVETAKRGLIPVNEYFQTSQPHIYAAGDVIGFPALASTAMEQGRLCSQHMFGAARPMKPVFPYGIYTIPEISVVGHSEQELTKLKIPYKTGVAKYEETAKGQMMGGPHIDGFLKLLFCPTSHRILGVSAIGENATEIIHIGQAVMSLNGTIEYFRDSVFNYPTYAELFRIAALDGINKANSINVAHAAKLAATANNNNNNQTTQTTQTPQSTAATTPTSATSAGDSKVSTSPPKQSSNAAA